MIVVWINYIKISMVGQFQSYGLRKLRITTLGKSHAIPNFWPKMAIFGQILWLPNPINIYYDTYFR